MYVDSVLWRTIPTTKEPQTLCKIGRNGGCNYYVVGKGVGCEGVGACW